MLEGAERELSVYEKLYTSVQFSTYRNLNFDFDLDHANKIAVATTIVQSMYLTKGTLLASS